MTLGRNLYLEPRFLSQDVALQIADLAKVPNHARECFCDCICGAAQEVWEWDRRGTSSRPSEALIEAANAARTMKTALQALNENDREWLRKVMSQHIIPASRHDPLRDPDWTVSVLADTFNAAIGRRLFDDREVTSPRKRGRRRGDINDRTFQDFVRHLLLSVRLADGDLTLDKNFKKGTLIDALNILRPHLPKGVIPICLPSTIQKIKTGFTKSPH